MLHHGKLVGALCDVRDAALDHHWNMPVHWEPLMDFHIPAPLPLPNTHPRGCLTIAQNTWQILDFHQWRLEM